MDSKIHEYLTDPGKLNTLVSTISSENLAELTKILSRIKASLDPEQPPESFKTITDESDWFRLREIVCPYLMQKPEGANIAEPVIVFMGKPYENKSEIVVDYDAFIDTYDFELKNYPEDNLYRGWEIYSEGKDVSFTAISNYPSGASGPFLKLVCDKSDTYEIFARYGPKRISVNFRRNKKIYNLKNLLAIDDKSKDRTAGPGETLYLVESDGIDSKRRVNFTIETDAKKNHFWPNEPIWQTHPPGEDGSSYDLVFPSESDDGFLYIDNYRVARNYEDRPTSRTTRVLAFGQYESVTVALLEADRIRYKATLPGNLDETLTGLTKAFEKISTKLSEIADTEIKAELKHDFRMDEYNNEEDGTRHYHRNRQLTIGLEAVISGEVPLPGYSYTWPNVLKIGLFLKPGIKFRIDGGSVERMRSETDTWTPYSMNFGGRVVGTLEAGVVAKNLSMKEYIEVDVKGYGKTVVGGGVAYKRIPLDALPNKVIFKATIDPLICGINAKVKVHSTLLDVQLIDFSKEWWLTDRAEYTSDPYEF